MLFLTHSFDKYFHTISPIAFFIHFYMYFYTCGTIFFRLVSTFSGDLSGSRKIKKVVRTQLTRAHAGFKNEMERPEERALCQGGVTTALPLASRAATGRIYLPGLPLLTGMAHLKPKSSFVSDVVQGCTRTQSGETQKGAYIVTDNTRWDIRLSTLSRTWTHLTNIYCRPNLW